MKNGLYSKVSLERKEERRWPEWVLVEMTSKPNSGNTFYNLIYIVEMVSKGLLADGGGINVMLTH